MQQRGKYLIQFELHAEELTKIKVDVMHSCDRGYIMDCSLRHKILQMDRPVPRYTSYPPSPHFHLLENPDLYENWLEALCPDASLSLYVHVPYCPKLCWYCGCHTRISRRYAPVEDYTYLMLREMEMLAARLAHAHPVKHIHFGGGSPGMLRSKDFRMMMDRLRALFTVSSDAEIAMEIDPRELSESRVAAYADSGINRVSLGVQSFDDRVLERVNRAQPYSLSCEAVRLFKNYGIENISFDLMYGLPVQTEKSIRDTVEKTIALAPQRVCFFGYAHVPWMKKHMRLIVESELPDKALRYDLFQTGSQMLEEAGYAPVGIDHFARPEDGLAQACKNGTLHRNFQGYTTDPSQCLLGIGASAIGRLPQGYIQNAPDLTLYRKKLLAARLPAEKFYSLTPDDKARAEVIEGLMCYMRADLRKTIRAHRLNPGYFNRAVTVLRKLEQEGLVRLSPAPALEKCGADPDNPCPDLALAPDSECIVEILPAGRPVARLVAAAFDSYDKYEPQLKRHARAI